MQQRRTAEASIGNLLHPKGHWHAITQQRELIVRERTRLACLVLCGLTILMAAADLAFLHGPDAWEIAAARVFASGVFLAIAHSLKADQRSSSSSWMSLALMHFVLPAQHLFVLPLLSALPEPAAILLRVGSTLPIATVAWMSLFPLTVVETAGLALPLLAFVLVGLGMLSETGTADVAAACAPLVLLIAVSAVSGASQLSHLIALVIRSTHDGLTGCLNRKAGEEIIDMQIRMAKRAGKSVGILFIDIDNFKAVNDGWGHEEGDKVLRGMADGLSERLRLTDKAIRWGGEEFVVLLPETDLAGAKPVLDKIRRGLGTRPDGKPVTASMGIAFSSENGADDVETLVAKADERMYEAKKNGKDKCVGPEGFSHPNQ
jgi:diguanylate cyclase (GGDEF)-like protein